MCMTSGSIIRGVLGWTVTLSTLVWAFIYKCCFVIRALVVTVVQKLITLPLMALNESFRHNAYGNQLLIIRI